MHCGDLVGVHARSGPRLALITAIQGSKASVLIGFEAKSERLPLRDLEPIHPLPSGCSEAGSLGASPWRLSPESLAAAHPSRRDLAAAWLLLEDQDDWIDLAELVGLLSPQDDPLHRAAGWLALQNQDLFRCKQSRFQRRPLADLRQLRRERRHGALQQQRHREWIALLRRRQPLDRSGLSVEQNAQLQALLELAAAPHGPSTGDPGLAPPLRLLLQELSCPPQLAEIRRLLADLALWDRHQLRCLAGTAWSTGFDPALEAEAEALAARAEEPWPGDEARLDLTAQRSVTIDDADTREVDDALALERDGQGRPWIWIHVADPDRLVAAGSPLDLEARRRASSLYLAAGSVPMFPVALAEGPMSLSQGRRCAAWSVAVRLEADGAIAERRLQRSWIRPIYRLSYGDADELIDYAPPQDDDLERLHGLLLTRRRWREVRGALLMDQPEGRFRRAGDRAELEVVEPSASRLMVAEAMILAGAVVAELGREQGLALPFRSQPTCELPPAAELEALPPGPVRHAALRRGLSRGLTSPQVAPHFSLGLEAYVQATSPIRRYGDLITQRQLLALLSGTTPLSAEQLGQELEALEPALRQGIQISREDQRHWQQVWFAEHRRERWDGVVLRWLRPQDGLALVRLEALAMDLAVVVRESCGPGDGVQVSVQEADPDGDVLRLVGHRSARQP